MGYVLCPEIEEHKQKPYLNSYANVLYTQSNSKKKKIIISTTGIFTSKPNNTTIKIKLINVQKDHSVLTLASFYLFSKKVTARNIDSNGALTSTMVKLTLKRHKRHGVDLILV